MKELLKILIGGLAVFMILSIGQEWTFFSSAWFGKEESREPLSQEEQKAAADAVHLTLTLMRHFYVSGGDSRFSERMPASEGIVREIMADVDYLARNHRIQDAELMRLDITSIDELAEDRVEIRTRESWLVRIRWVADGREAEPPKSLTINGKYLVVRGGRGWRVEGWDLADQPAERVVPTA